jgi:hypothetical protein
MSSQHRRGTKTFRPDPDDYTAAKEVLADRGHHVSSYLTACLRWLRADPDAALAAVAGSWPQSRPVGRPPIDQASDPAGGGHRVTTLSVSSTPVTGTSAVRPPTPAKEE